MRLGGYRKGACDVWKDTCGGKVEAVLTGLYPYAGIDVTDRLSLWAAAGMRSEVLRPEGGKGLSLALKGDARFTRTSSASTQGLAASDADVRPMRAGIEGLAALRARRRRRERHPVVRGRGAARRRRRGDRAALRHEGARAGGAPVLGVPGVGRERVLRPGPAPGDRPGLALALRQGWGAAPAGGMDALLWRETLAGLAANDGGAGNGFQASGRLEGEVGYGLPLFGDRFTGTPNVGFGLSDGGVRDYRIGWRLTSAVPGDPGFEVSLDATRRGPANDGKPEHGVTLRAAIRW